VVLEASRFSFSRLSDANGLAFATSFAMPPLAECWASPGDVQNSPTFTIERLQALAELNHDAQELEDLWSCCLNNQPGVPICAYRVSDPKHTTYGVGGPSGSFLVAMLAAKQGRSVHLWINDDGGRYGDPRGVSPTSSTEIPNLLAHVTFLGRVRG
jgi:hypothetical protein